MSEPQTTYTLDEFNDLRNQNRDEEDVHIAVVEWADLQAASRPALELLHHVPNGGSRHPAEGLALRKMGTRQGVPDLCLPVPRYCADSELSHGLYLELKSPSGRLRPEQAWWLWRLKMQGYAVAVAWGFDEATTILDDYLRGEHAHQDSLNLKSKAEPPRHVQ